MTGYPWPGNVRELRNLCERLTLLLPGKTIRVENLPVEFRAATATRHHIVALPSSGLDLTELEKDLIAQALEHTGGNRSRAARLLGLTRDTLLYRLKKFSLA
jgi:DNA-binding NtrC family response regulator